MELLQTLRIINTVVSLSAVFPSLYIIKKILKERPLIKTEYKIFNNVLTLIGAATAIVGVLNGAILLAIMIIDGAWSSTTDGLSLINMKNLAVNIAIFLISGSLAYLVYRHKKDPKNLK